MKIFTIDKGTFYNFSPKCQDFFLFAPIDKEDILDDRCAAEPVRAL